MQVRSLLRPVFTLGLAAALVVSSQPQGVYAAEPVVVAVGVASWEPDRERLVVPVSGPAPRVHIQQLAARQFVADLTGCTLAVSAPQGAVVGHSRLSGWSMTAEPTLKGVRVRMTVTDDVRPVARYDAALRGFVFTFASDVAGQPQLAPAPKFALKTPGKPGGVEPRFPTRVALADGFPVRPSVARLAPDHAAAPVTQAPKAASTQAAARVAKAAAAPVALAAHGSAVEHRTAANGPTRRVPPAAKAPAASKVARAAARTVTRPTLHPAFAAAAATKLAVARPAHRGWVPLVLLAAADPAPRTTVAAAAKGRKAIKVARTARKSSPKVHIARRNDVARLGLPAYRSGAEVLVIPVQSGRIARSNVETVRLNKRWSYIDVAGAVPAFSGVRYHEREDKRFQRWVMARRPGRDITRVSFAVGVPSRLDVKVADDAVLVAVRPVGTALAQGPVTSSRREAVAATPRRASAPVAARMPAAGPAVVAQPVAVAAAESDKAPEAAPKMVEAAPKAAEAKPTAHRLAVRAGLARRSPVSGLAESRVRRPFYDAERFGLAIPYEGRAPLYRWARRSEQGAVIELKADVLSPSHLQPDARRTGAWGSWKLGRRSHRGPLALELAFSQPSEVSIAADPERKQLLVIPQPRIAKVAVAEASPVRSALAPLVVDQAGSNLFIPFRGEVPRYVIEQVTPTFAYVVFEAASLRDGGIQFFTPNAHPALNYLLVTQPEGTSTVRLAVSLSQPAAAAVYQDPANTRLVVTLAQDTPMVQATGPKALRVPEPWPGAARPAPQVQGDKGGLPRT
ncbi:MAG: hypothetical protein VKS61_05515 [Candidatus Sericytochromatia bacterium]|nr:hypothetical protein [Candidatus Sericytochromatia bacterium]